MHPELSGQEQHTLAFVQAQLSSWGIACIDVPRGGLLGVLDGAGAGKTVLLRADVDALPIQESQVNLRGEKACVSQVAGVSHACGHDAHTAMLLVQAKVLSAHTDAFRGRIIFCFERGEEATENYIQYLIRYLESHKALHVDACYATHVRWNLPSGKISVMHGAPLAGVMGFEIKIKGKGGHGARPDLACSPIDCFAALCAELNALRLRRIDPFGTLAFSIGSVHSGQVRNVIPDELVFSGSARCFDMDGVGQAFRRELCRLLDGVTALYGCSWQALSMPAPLYEVENHETCVRIAREAVQKYLGDGVLTDVEPWMASESFSSMLKLYPGVLTFTGIQNLEKGAGANHHTPAFDVDEEGLLYGAATAVGFALEFLRQAPEIPFERRIVSLEDLLSRTF